MFENVEFPTIKDAVPSLRDPVGYVRGVLANMQECKRKHSTAVVWIGTTGKGAIPNYRVAPLDSFDALMTDHHDLPEYVEAYHGSSHKKISDWKLRGLNWSGNSMTFEEVQQLLGELRNFKSRKI